MRLILVRGPVKPIPPPTRNDAHLLSVFRSILVKLWLHCCLLALISLCRVGSMCVHVCERACIHARGVHAQVFWPKFCIQCMVSDTHFLPLSETLLCCCLACSVLTFCSCVCYSFVLMIMMMTGGALFCSHVNHAHDVFFLGWSGNLQDCIVCCLFVFGPWKWSHGKGSRSSNSQYTRVTANPCKSGST